MSVSLSAGLPLCFPIKSIWLPITQATGSLSLQPSVNLPVYPVIAQAGRLSGFQCVRVFSSVSPAFLSVRLSIHHVIPHPHFSPRVELGSLITQDHLCRHHQASDPNGAEQAGQPRSPPPSSPRVHTPASTVQPLPSSPTPPTPPPAPPLSSPGVS